MKKILLASLLGLGMMSAQAADLVTNGGFDDGAAGWTFSDGTVAIANVSAYINCCGIDGASYTNSAGAAFFGWGQQTGGTLSQTLSTVAGKTYDVSFAYGAISDANLQTMTVGVENGTNYVAGGAALSSTDVSAFGTHSQADLVSPYSFSFTATGNSTTLFFKDTSASSLNTDGMVDNVHVLAAVPEPETYAMLLAGLGLLGFMARRRRQG